MTSGRLGVDSESTWNRFGVDSGSIRGRPACPSWPIFPEFHGTFRRLAGYGAIAQSRPDVPKVWSGEYGLECDIWSAGMVLHELLSGRLPRSCEEAACGEAWAAISPAGRELVLGLLRRAPAQRWALQHCLAHPWLAPRPGEAPEQAARGSDMRPHRHRRMGVALPTAWGSAADSTSGAADLGRAPPTPSAAPPTPWAAPTLR